MISQTRGRENQNIKRKKMMFQIFKKKLKFKFSLSKSFILFTNLKINHFPIKKNYLINRYINYFKNEK